MITLEYCYSTIHIYQGHTVLEMVVNGLPILYQEFSDESVDEKYGQEWLQGVADRANDMVQGHSITKPHVRALHITMPHTIWYPQTKGE